MALTVLLWPEYRAEAELALSVMKLSMEWVCRSWLAKLEGLCPDWCLFWKTNHLVTNDGELVDLEPSLVLAVDGLVSEEAGGGNHVGGHAITYQGC